MHTKAPRKCTECQNALLLWQALLVLSKSSRVDPFELLLWIKQKKTWNPHAEKRNKALISCPNPNTEAEPCQIICRMNAKNLHSPNSKMYNVIQELQKIWITGQMELQRLSFLPHFSGEEFCNKKIGFLWIFSVIYHILGPYILPKFSFNKEMENEKKNTFLFLKLAPDLRCWFKKIGQINIISNYEFRKNDILDVWTLLLSHFSCSSFIKCFQKLKWIHQQFPSVCFSSLWTQLLHSLWLKDTQAWTGLVYLTS